MQIDYFFATISPFVYLAGTRLEADCGAARRDHRLQAAGRAARCSRGPAGRCWPSVMPAARPTGCRNCGGRSKKLGMPLNLQPAFFPVNPAPIVLCRSSAAAKAGGGDLARAGAWLSPARSGPRTATSPTTRWCRKSCARMASTRAGRPWHADGRRNLCRAIWKRPWRAASSACRSMSWGTSCSGGRTGWTTSTCICPESCRCLKTC